jgi:hypothetical protein
VTIEERYQSARAAQRRAHRAFTRHIDGCRDCGAYLCRVGRGLEVDADAAGWRMDQARTELRRARRLAAPIAA